MQVNFITFDELAELLTETKTLKMLDDPLSGNRVYVLDGGRSYGDIIAITGINGGAVVIYPPESFDRETGSIHDQARGEQE